VSAAILRAMSQSNTLWSVARIATVAGLLVGAAGIAVMKLGGAGMPAVPPGAVLMVIAAGLVGVTPRKWAAALAALIALFELIAVTISLTDLGDDALVSAGTIVRFTGVVAALAAAATTLTRRH
jgi:hypothetical protein